MACGSVCTRDAQGGDGTVTRSAASYLRWTFHGPWLAGGSEAMRETTLTMLRRIVRKGTNFMGHSLADDFVVL